VKDPFPETRSSVNLQRRRGTMKLIPALAMTVGLGLAAGAPAAQAADWSVGISIGVPGVVVAPPPVYVAPPGYYAPEAPPVYVLPPGYYGPYVPPPGYVVAPGYARDYDRDYYRHPGWYRRHHEDDDD
jgi:hypothetical protein